MAAVMSNLSIALEDFTPEDGKHRTPEQRCLLIDAVFNLRLDGYTVPEIATELGISTTYANNLLKERLARPPEALEDVRRIELDRLEKMHKRVERFNAKLPDGSFSKDALETQLKIATRRAALQGLDAAQKFEVTTKVSPNALTDLTDEELMLIRQVLNRVRGVMNAPQPPPPEIETVAPEQLTFDKEEGNGDA